MMVNCLRMLEARGVSVWQDRITHRELMAGDLAKLIADDGLSGVIYDLATLHTAICHLTDFESAITDLAQEGKDPKAILDALVIQDARDMADALLPVWERTNGRDGFVSVDLLIRQAFDRDACIADAHRLWHAIARPNLMIKIPGIVEAIPAIRECLVGGLNIQVTLLSSMARYEEVVGAYLDAIETRLVRGLAVDRVASVAGFLVEPVDTIVDHTIEAMLQASSGPAARSQLEGLVGKVAVANAKLAYARFAQVFSPADDRWDKLAGGGARPQRLMWTDTDVHDSKRRDVLYVEELIAPETVVALSPTTLAAFREHGEVRAATATEGLDEATAIIQAVSDVGIDLGYLSRQLEDDCIKRLEAADRALLEDIAQKS